MKRSRHKNIIKEHLYNNIDINNDLLDEISVYFESFYKYITRILWDEKPTIYGFLKIHQLVLNSARTLSIWLEF